MMSNTSSTLKFEYAVQKAEDGQYLTFVYYTHGALRQAVALTEEKIEELSLILLQSLQVIGKQKEDDNAH